MRVHQAFPVLLALILLCTSVLSQPTGVDIQPIAKPPEKKTGVQGATAWVMKNIWFFIIFLAIGLGIILIMFIWKKIASRIDPFFENWKKTKELCKLNKRWSITEVYRVSSDTGLKWLGDYEGDCILEDGTINIMWSNWKWGIGGKILRIIFFPLMPLWKLVMKDFSILKAPYDERETFLVTDETQKELKDGERLIKVELKTGKKDERGNDIYEEATIKRTTNKIEYAVFDQSGHVLIKAISLSKTKNFFCPVISTPEGEVIDTRKDIFAKESSEALMGGLYNLTTDFANIMRERIGLEPKVRYVQKTEGTEVRED